MENFGKYYILMVLLEVVFVMKFLQWQTVKAEWHIAKTASINLVQENKKNGTGHRNIKVILKTRATPGRIATDISRLETHHYVYLSDEGTEMTEMWTSITASPAEARVPCYEVFPGLGYYKYHTKAVTWDQAYSTCVGEGSHLIVLNDEAEANVVKQFIGRKVPVQGATFPNYIWAGFHDRGLEGDFRTVLGGALNKTGYIKWHGSQPNNAPFGVEPDEDCGVLDNNALMHDSPCLIKYPFICEQPL